MRSHRLDRLSLLTKGAALVGLGLSSMACDKNDPTPVPPTVNMPTPNATAFPADAAPLPITMNAPASVDAGDAPDAGASLVPLGKRPPHMNAPPNRNLPNPTPDPTPTGKP